MTDATMTDIPRGQGLDMHYAGVDWLRSNLKAAVRRGEKAGKKLMREDISPLGVTVAEALGYVFKGIYHLNAKALLRAGWWNERVVEVAIHQELATWDHNALTVLVVVCHDMGLRLAIHPHGPRLLRLQFTQRTCRDGCIAKRMPTLEQHIEAIRSGYRVIGPEEMRALSDDAAERSPPQKNGLAGAPGPATAGDEVEREAG